MEHAAPDQHSADSSFGFRNINNKHKDLILTISFVLMLGDSAGETDFNRSNQIYQSEPEQED